MFCPLALVEGFVALSESLRSRRVAGLASPLCIVVVEDSLLVDGLALVGVLALSGAEVLAAVAVETLRALFER